jgi:hypothetical protein
MESALVDQVAKRERFGLILHPGSGREQLTGCEIHMRSSTKSRASRELLDAGVTKLSRRLKSAFDPTGILNPGAHVRGGLGRVLSAWTADSGG